MSNWGKASILLVIVLGGVAGAVFIHDRLAGSVALAVNALCFLVTSFIIGSLESRRLALQLRREWKEIRDTTLERMANAARRVDPVTEGMIRRTLYQDRFISPRQLGERTMYRDERYLP